MDIYFTICSNNYLAQAKSLGESILHFNTDSKFVVCLVDKFNSDIDYTLFSDFLIITVDELNISNFNSIYNKYNIIELNTCVKASFFKYIFRNYDKCNNVIYFDPDILVYKPLNPLIEYLKSFDILITPHILSPIEFDGKLPSENLFLNYGLYNLGFIAISRRCFENSEFLNWWESRTLENGFDNVCNGFFVDQLYINFTPIFFNSVKILFEKGYNVAPWNLHERTLIINNKNEYIMDDNSPLYFFHFSSYNFKKPEILSKHYNRYSFSLFPLLLDLYGHYHSILIENGIESYSLIECYYVIERSKYLNSIKKNISFASKFKSVLKSFIPPIILKMYILLKINATNFNNNN